MPNAIASPDIDVEHTHSRLTSTLPRATASVGVLAAAARPAVRLSCGLPESRWLRTARSHWPGSSRSPSSVQSSAGPSSPS